MEQKQVYIGLTDEQVVESRRLHGGNVLTPPQKKSVWILFSKSSTTLLSVYY